MLVHRPSPVPIPPALTHPSGNRMARGLADELFQFLHLDEMSTPCVQDHVCTPHGSAGLVRQGASWCGWQKHWGTAGTILPLPLSLCLCLSLLLSLLSLSSHSSLLVSVFLSLSLFFSVSVYLPVSVFLSLSLSLSFALCLSISVSLSLQTYYVRPVYPAFIPSSNPE